MKIAILSNRERSFVPTLAEGLHRMLRKANVESRIFYGGLSAIRFNRESYYPHRQFRGFYKQLKFKHLLSRLSKFDAVVIVGFLPDAFLKSFMMDKVVRASLPNIPLILYSNYYLPTRTGWEQALRQGSEKLGIISNNNYGLERYDYYLCSSVTSETPLVGDVHPFCQIGLNLETNSLYPSRKKRFAALLDFERPSHSTEREIQISALKKTNTPFFELKGSYSRNKIRSIYRQSSIYFLAHRESFGVPICELQACGGLIFSPQATWCPSHGIKESYAKSGLGRLSSNFLIYDNSEEKLVKQIKKVKHSYDPYETFETFISNHPDFIYGNQDELGKFISLLEQKKITAQSHTNYFSIHK